MDFFQAQRTAHQRTRHLVLLFMAAVATIVAANCLGVHLILAKSFDYTPAEALSPNWTLLGAVAGGTLVVILAGTVYRTAKLRSGGPAVAEMAGGRAVEPGTAEAAERRLLNVVEEMAIASGVPVPAVYVLDDNGINAFAAGLTIHDAAVAVTRGALERLDRDEIQGVVAHEFSHILNGDMRMNVRLIGVLFGILLIAVVGRILLRGRRVGSRRTRGGIALLAIAFILVGYVGVLFGRLIKASISRQREFLADAAAVQFTRNPDGIAGALKKIGGHVSGSRIDDAEAEELSHLFFADALGANILATHPPLTERIRRIEPSFDGQFVTVDDVMATVETSGRPAVSAFAGPEGRAPDPATAGLAGAGGGEAAGGPTAGSAGDGADPGDDAPGRKSGETSVAARAEDLMASIGAPTLAHVSRAARLLESIPPELDAAARTPGGAQALVAALVLDADEGIADRQHAVVRKHGGEGLRAWVDDLASRVREQPREARLALLDLALPALRRLPPETAANFRNAVDELVRADGRVHLFEYALARVLKRHLSPVDGRPGRRRPHRSHARLRDGIEVLLSAVARSGATEEAAARVAFEAGAASLSRSIGELHLRGAADVRLARIDDALDQLEHGSLDVRRSFLAACARCVAYDARVRPSEVEILRAIAEGLECPMPPLVVDPTPARASGRVR